MVGACGNLGELGGTHPNERMRPHTICLAGTWQERRPVPGVLRPTSQPLYPTTTSQPVPRKLQRPEIPEVPSPQTGPGGRGGGGGGGVFFLGIGTKAAVVSPHDLPNPGSRCRYPLVGHRLYPWFEPFLFLLPLSDLVEQHGADPKPSRAEPIQHSATAPRSAILPILHTLLLVVPDPRPRATFRPHTRRSPRDATRFSTASLSL